MSVPLSLNRGRQRMALHHTTIRVLQPMDMPIYYHINPKVLQCSINSLTLALGSLVSFRSWRFTFHTMFPYLTHYFFCSLFLTMYICNLLSYYSHKHKCQIILFCVVIYLLLKCFCIASQDRCHVTFQLEHACDSVWRECYHWLCTKAKSILLICNLDMQ